MNIPENLKYTKTHEWVMEEGGVVRVGISDHAQAEISDVVHIELPEANAAVEKGQPVVVVESVKAAFDIYSPVDGVVTKVNDAVIEAPEKVNQEPYGTGYFFEIKPSGNLEGLMDAAGYKKFLEEAKS